jgi:citrate lyase beta subunit
MNSYFESKTDIETEKIANTSSLAMFHVIQILEQATSQKRKQNAYQILHNIIKMFINCNWVVTRWQWLFYT